MRRRIGIAALIVLAAAASAAVGTAPAKAASPEYLSAVRKLHLIRDGKAAPGSTLQFTPREIEAWARVEIPKRIPDGFRDPRVQLGEGTATGRAVVDFLRMRHAKGVETNWLVAKMIQGERPLAMSVRLTSSGGWATAYLTRVEISGVAATGAVLDFLIRTFFLSLYPEAKIGQPFELGYNIERIEIHPSAVTLRLWPAKQKAPSRPPTQRR